MGGRAIYGLSGMKRKDAFRKLRTICQRLDDRDAGQFPVIPLRLYLFGSLLTDKPDPSDVDLLFKFQDRTDLDPDDIVHRFSSDTPLELVWEPGLAWPQIVDRIESEPISWDPVAEEQYERVQETYRQIAKEQGTRAAREWLGRQAQTPSPRRRAGEGRNQDQGDFDLSSHRR
jgi:predicted nucleotidyltransferase